MKDKCHLLQEATPSILGEVADLSNEYKESRKVKKKRNVSQTKKQDKTLKKDLNKTEMNNLPDKDLRIMVLNMLTEPGKRN